jgi:Lrp/AsnC family leucine-responsive transcriptional regulator
MDNSLDEIDYQILHLLQQNGRMTNAALAEAVGLTPTPMLQRIKKLEHRGVIRGYTAIIDPIAMGLGLIGYVAVQMTKHRLEIHQEFVAEVLKFPEVLECHHVSGEDDYLLKVLVRDMQAYEDFLLRRLTKVTEISRVKTTFVMSSPKMVMTIPVTGLVTGQ